MSFDGLGVHLGNLARLSDAQTRSISPENFNGVKGQGGMASEGVGAPQARLLGRGWKISPAVVIGAGTTFDLADIEGPGAIQQIWMTPKGNWRLMILRIYWDEQEQPSVECPLGDFFACAWGEYAQLSSLAVCINPRSGLNCYWEMPFRKRCRITLENLDTQEIKLFYQINYALTEVAEDRGYFHAQFRRANRLAHKDVYGILDGVKGQGQYVGTYLAWGTYFDDWWGEGEIKFYLDGDTEFPTMCGTGTEDYIGGSYDFQNPATGRYQAFSTPYSGLIQVLEGDAVGGLRGRFGLYRWHITDPIRFHHDLRVTIQALGWGSDGLFVPLEDDIASVAYWYQALPTAPFPALPNREQLNAGLAR